MGAERHGADVLIVNRRGLHARAAAKLVRTAEAFTADITVTKDDMTVGATSILGLMMLAAGAGTTLRIEAEGVDAEAALRALVDLIGRGFDES